MYRHKNAVPQSQGMSSKSSLGPVEVLQRQAEMLGEQRRCEASGCRNLVPAGVTESLLIALVFGRQDLFLG